VNSQRATPSLFTPFQKRDFRFLFAVLACQTLGSHALAVILGFTIYEITASKLAIGYLGLVEAIPSLSLALIGGHFADRHDRRSILRISLGALSISALVLAAITSLYAGRTGVAAIYAVVFVAGIARGFNEPAVVALEAQILPKQLLVRSATLMSVCFLASGIAGPLLAGFSFAFLGPAGTFLIIATLYLAAWMLNLQIGRRPPQGAVDAEPLLKSVIAGVRYVWNDQVLLGSMACDLFAVLFGGAIALLPVFAKDVLHVGPTQLGMLAAAPTSGALLTMALAARFPPGRNAGRQFLFAVAAFGVTMIIFALSTSYYLSLAMLFLSGVFDGISVVIRRAITRLMSPDHLRGRIAAVSMIFIGSSNELGALESGLAAAAIGTTRSVWLGGIVTLLVVASAAIFAPKLRRLSLAAPIKLPTSAEPDAAT
jgi:MFS family permease